MAAAEESPRLEVVAKALSDVLVEGEEFLVQRLHGEVLVTPPRSSKFKEEHPRLYGNLLSLDEQLATGCGHMVLVMLAAAGLCVSLNVGLWDDLLGRPLADGLRQWWVYVLIAVTAFVAGGYLTDWEERRAYRRGRDELLALMANEGFERDSLVVLIQNLAELERVTKHLKLDRQAGRPRLMTGE